MWCKGLESMGLFGLYPVADDYCMWAPRRFFDKLQNVYLDVTLFVMSSFVEVDSYWFIGITSFYVPQVSCEPGT